MYMGESFLFRTYALRDFVYVFNSCNLRPWPMRLIAGDANFGASSKDIVREHWCGIE